MFKYILSLSLLTLGASINMEAGNKRNNNCNPCFNCPAASGLSGIRGTWQTVAPFVDPDIDKPGSVGQTPVFGCGFSVSSTNICVKDLTGHIATTQDFVLQYTFTTPVKFDQPLCKTPSVVTQIDDNIPNDAYGCSSSTVTIIPGFGTVVSLSNSETISFVSKNGFTANTVLLVAVTVEGPYSNSLEAAIALANIIVGGLVNAPGIAAKTDFIASVEERCCEQ